MQCRRNMELAKRMGQHGEDSDQIPGLMGRETDHGKG